MKNKCQFGRIDEDKNIICKLFTLTAEYDVYCGYGPLNDEPEFKKQEFCLQFKKVGK